MKVWSIKQGLCMRASEVPKFEFEVPKCEFEVPKSEDLGHQRLWAP